MKKWILMLALVLPLTTYGSVLSDHLQEIGVTIIANNAQGSGVVKIRDGEQYVWTAGHVVSRCRHTRTVVDAATYSERTIVYFDDVIVAKDVLQAGNKVGTVFASAEVIKYSGIENGEDIAILHIKQKNFVHDSVSFYLGETIPAIGTEVVHVGSLRGHFGYNSMTYGLISQQGRLLSGNKPFDQTSHTAYPGSSGGGTYLKENGQYIGMLVRGTPGGETFNFITPVRRLSTWAKKHDVMWLMDDTVAVTKITSVESFDEAPGISMFSIFGLDGMKTMEFIWK